MLGSNSSHEDNISETGRIDYFRFTLAATNTIRLSFGRLRLNVDLFLEDASGEALGKSIGRSSQSESIARTLPAGVYHVRVAAQEAGESPLQAEPGKPRGHGERAAGDVHRGGRRCAARRKAWASSPGWENPAAKTTKSTAGTTRSTTTASRCVRSGAGRGSDCAGIHWNREQDGGPKNLTPTRKKEESPGPHSPPLVSNAQPRPLQFSPNR